MITNKYLLKLFTNIIIRNIVTATMLEGYDMNILKDYVFRLYPDKNREELINKTFGCIKNIYNYFLDDKKEYKETNKNKSAYDKIKVCLDHNSAVNIRFKELGKYMLYLKIGI